MESLRISEKNKIHDRLKQIDIYVKRNKNTLNSVSASDKLFIEKINKKNQDYADEIDVLNKRLVGLSNGSLDSELTSVLDTNNKMMKKNVEKTNQKNQMKREEKEKEKETIDNFYKASRDYSRPSARNLEKETNKFFYFCQSVPDYILRNLDEMPNNKGYIWKGVWCFGRLKEEKGKPVIMFEKCRDGIMKIYEIDEYERKIFEKKGKDRKILISSEPRNKLF